MTDFIPIIVDKSHLVAIGERLYSESLDFIRELVANAYDADATWVKISLVDDGVIVEDDGGGMDREGLRQYFTIGSSYKRTHQISPRFKRTRIGEFGIGKFSVLSLCDRFELFTRKNGYAATVIFDRQDFERQESWQVPIIEHKTDHKRSGTRITLSGFKRPIPTETLERKLREQFPLTDKNFTIYIDGIAVTPKYIPGTRFRIREKTEFGSVNGEIIISSLLLPAEQVGVGIRVKKMLIRRELFGLDEARDVGKRRITGEVYADFLPLTASRDNVITDRPEYQAFLAVIQKKIKQVSRRLRKARNRRLDVKTNQSLSDAMLNIKRAIRKNSDLFLSHDLPLFSKETEKAETIIEKLNEGMTMQKIGSKTPPHPKSAKLPGEISRKMKKETRERVKTVLKDKNRLVKKLKIGGTSIVCSLAHLGDDEVESFTEGGVIFINRDHPLFVKTAAHEELSRFYLLRLITQEVSLMTHPNNPRSAFDIQSRLLRDAVG
ncbi:MAG TPA: ATP-binding protein [Patescibacteria group bacterium]|nr:ATP-binding protein [Patescibacteria group bacterium]